MISTGSRNGKPLVETGAVLRVRDLRGRHGFFASHTLTTVDDTVIYFRLDVGDVRGWIHVEHHRAGHAWPDPEYQISTFATPQPFGGRKWCFACPLGGKPCGVLCLPIGAEQFASRQAHGLAFTSQRLRAPARAAVRAQRIRLDLGGSADLDAPFPFRPRGMHVTTYERRRNVGVEPEAQVRCGPRSRCLQLESS